MVVKIKRKPHLDGVYNEQKKIRRMYSKSSNLRKKEKPTLEGKLALRTAISLESLQNGYIEIHNQIIAQIYAYSNELNTVDSSLVDLAIEKIFLQRLIGTLSEYLSRVRKRVLSEMKEIVNIFNKKLELMDSQDMACVEKNSLNSLLKRPISNISPEENEKTAKTIDFSSKNASIDSSHDNIKVAESEVGLSNAGDSNFSIDFHKFSGYDFDLNEFITNSHQESRDDRADLIDSQICENLWSDFLSK
ncbi:uncharacterized protein NEMAJ01_1305 [Nematocida major]|uniref:uncharacterized protein n=1 Tax=Nematocida major TaxID=1912982 RepID=UPI002007DEF0|nr:uncharacterized protein NEMAJ01_1305 [Nematocida major]KAH9386409.1 hypothetical protein NEMAJ01_1305 [Nematocida major]